LAAQNLDLLPLRDLIAGSYSQEILMKKLGEFTCAFDADVEGFIRNKAVNYEKAGYSRTFIYQSHDETHGSTMDSFLVAK
jgi:hypothetical protein